MQSLILHWNFQWWCLPLLFMSIRVGATIEEGGILYNWKKNYLTDPAGVLSSWNGASDPCGGTWRRVLCDNTGHVSRVDFGCKGLSGSLSPELGQLSGLLTLTVCNNSLSGRIPEEFGNLAALTQLDLHYNNLSGPIPDSFQKLTNLSYLILNRNKISGSFPMSLTSLNGIPDIDLGSNSISGTLNVTRILDVIEATASTGQGQSIGVVSLIDNNITDIVYRPDDLLNNRIVFKLQGNPYCSGLTENYDDGKRCFCLQNCSLTSATSKTGKKSQHLAIKLGTISCVVLLVFAICMGVIFRSKRQEKRKLTKLNIEYRHKFAEFEVNPQPFSYNELRLATQNFNECTKLGKGSFGTVYKGTLPNGNEVAIKKLQPKIAAQEKVDDFLNEVVFITKMKHKNLVNLKGYCMRENERILVYEFVENMDVEQALLMGKNKEAMNWPVRFKICLGVAQGLHYLHTFAQPRVIHRDIKASNVLLDTNYHPKIADFGLALLFPDEKTHISTVTVAGTRGYLAPEYASYGQLSEKADVYSFGVLCLEIISGRRNSDFSKPTCQVYLLSWAWQLYEEGKLKGLIDPSLHLHGDEELQALRVINIALLCLQQIPERRPSMSDAQTALQRNMELDEVVLSPVNVMVDSSILEESTLLSLSLIESKNSTR